MSSIAALYSAPLAHSVPSISHAKTHLSYKPYHLSLKTKNSHNLLYISTSATTDNGSSTPAAAAVVDDETPPTPEAPEVKEDSSESNGSVPPPPPPAAVTAGAEAVQGETVIKFENPKWINGTWDLTQFQKDGKPDWDAVIDAEARRRKWLQDNPESSNNDEPVLFDTSIVPWWAWIKRFHLPEAELLNGRAAMIGFFMAYFVDSLTGVGLVDQMGNFFCKTLLFVAVAGVLLIRKNEDIDNLKQLLDETTFYDKQWQATWKEDTSTTSKKE